MKRVAFGLVAAATMAGCVPSPQNYESEPVVLKTPKGNVTCQLYTPELVIWDRSIDRPYGMSVETADAICRKEGQRQKANS